MTINWDDYPNFSEGEFDCSHCGKVHMEKKFLDRLQALRTEYGRSMTVTSGFRCAQHPNEVKKAKPGSHNTGRAADIHCTGQDAFTLIQLALKHGFTGIGVNMKGKYINRFIHLDDIQESPRPNVWSY